MFDTFVYDVGLLTIGIVVLVVIPYGIAKLYYGRDGQETFEQKTDREIRELKEERERKKQKEE